MARAKLDATIMQKICDLLRAGNFLDVSARAAGVHPTTLPRWLRKGREQKKGKHHRFAEAVEKAIAEADARDVALIAKHATVDWRAAGDFLSVQAGVVSNNYSVLWRGRGCGHDDYSTLGAPR